MVHSMSSDAKLGEERKLGNAVDVFVYFFSILCRYRENVKWGQSNFKFCNHQQISTDTGKYSKYFNWQKEKYIKEREFSLESINLGLNPSPITA